MPGAQVYLGSEKALPCGMDPGARAQQEKCLSFVLLRPQVPQLVAKNKPRQMLPGPLSCSSLGLPALSQWARWWAPVSRPINKGSAAISSAQLPFSSPEARPLHSCCAGKSPVRTWLPSVKSFIRECYIFVQVPFHCSGPAALATANEQ